MVVLSAKLEGLDSLVRRLAAGEAAAARGSERTRAAMRLVGLEELEHQRATFEAKSRGAIPGWRRLSPLTALLRRSGRAKKVVGWTQLVEIAAVLPVGVDTGRLRASLAAGAPGNVLRDEPMAVTLGTNVDYARRFHAGGPSGEAAVASREEADRVARRVRKVLPGHKAERTPGGRKSRARKAWNPEFFRIRGWLRKLVGRVFSSEARPILQPPSAERLAAYAARVKDAIVEDLSRARNG